MHEQLVETSFGNGRFRVDKHLQGKGLRQLFRGTDMATGDTVFISYDKLPKHTTIERFVDTTGARAPGVLELVFAGPADDASLSAYWGVVERVPTGAEWLPAVIGQHPAEVAADPVPRRLPAHDATTALQTALALGRSAGRILADTAATGMLLARARPETMWIERGAVRAMSERSELMFAASYVTSFVWPVFDRYYYAPEIDRKAATIDDRALVFSLSIMIAEWATGLYPFAKKDYALGPRSDSVALELPERLAALLTSGMRIDANERPALRPFLAELNRC